MAEKNFENFQKIFNEHYGILKRSQALKLGIPEHKLYEMYKTGELIKEGRGLYRLKDAQPLGNPDLVQVGLLVPKGVICLISALYFHEMTTQIPYSVYIALPNDVKKPRIDYPPLEVFLLRPNSYSAGIDEHIIDGVKVKIYNPEKTVADCFKLRRRIGEDVALEALKEYVNRPKTDISRLMEYARIDRVEKIVEPYLKSLL
jgi:predicted transcriptional regulator of viral defense system